MLCRIITYFLVKCRCSPSRSQIESEESNLPTLLSLHFQSASHRGSLASHSIRFNLFEPNFSLSSLGFSWWAAIRLNCNEISGCQSILPLLQLGICLFWALECSMLLLCCCSCCVVLLLVLLSPRLQRRGRSSYSNLQREQQQCVLNKFRRNEVQWAGSRGGVADVS